MRHYMFSDETLKKSNFKGGGIEYLFSKYRIYLRKVLVRETGGEYKTDNLNPLFHYTLCEP